MAVWAVVLLVAACGSRRAGTEFAQIEIEIDNRNFSDATIYLNWRGDRRRLGMVSGKDQATFRSPWHSSQAFIEVEFLAGSTQRSGSFAAAPGQSFTAVIPAVAEQQIQIIAR